MSHKPNHLIAETSPYLLQHAHNPVEWYAWRPEAFARSRREDKPILVSIGYSTCHWCHVMERESFEDPDVAAFMNEHFLNIKVDREERPDVDQIYMDVVQAISGNGGWPLNAFLMPDGRPFYAGTYYPPRPGYGRPSWMQLLHHLYLLWRDKRDTVEQQATRLLEILSGSAGTSAFEIGLEQVRGSGKLERELPERIFERLSDTFDRMEGGFGSAPKFPGTMSLEYLLAYHHFTGDQRALHHVQLSLDKMISGGIYDQLGGGFARYATDRAWLVPHFEKMLYDNALLVGLLADAYRVTGEARYLETIHQTLGWVHREMTSDEGGFYSALDADSEGEEGKCYVWGMQEIEQLLGSEAGLFCDFFGVSPSGNWEGKNILHRPELLDHFAKARSLEPSWLRAKLNAACATLLASRQQRVPPGLDDKILLDWNALMVSALAKAQQATGEEAYRTRAERNLRFLLDKLVKPNGLGMFHSYKAGRAQYDAYLNDYAYLIEALLDFYEVNLDTALLERAAALVEYVEQRFFDESQGLYFFTSSEQEALIVRRKEINDLAVPSGNAVMVRNLQRLGILLERQGYRNRATDMLRRLLPAVESYPGSFARWASELLGEVFPFREIAVVGSEAARIAADLNHLYLPNRVLMASPDENDDYPLLKNKTATGQTLIYFCQDYACQRPVATLEDFKKLL
jgi:hypothetical protein